MLQKFPREIIEKILYHCDGRTLQNAESVDGEWKQIVQYLTKKFNVWKDCCRQDIPEHELVQYIEKWTVDCDEEINWRDLYENWLYWHDISKNIDFNVEPFGKLNRQAMCICSVGNYTAVGFDNGSVRVYNDRTYVRSYRHLVTEVQSIHFAPDLRDDHQTSELLIHYQNEVFINDFRYTTEHVVFRNCRLFSIYKNFMCGVSHEGRITIARITTDVPNWQKSYQVVTFARIYSPDTVKCCALSKHVCLLLVNDKLKVINYKDGSRSSHLMAVELTTLQFSFQPNYTMRRDVWMFHNKVILAVTKSTDLMQQQLFELFILNEEEKSNSKKMFVPWKTFNAFITCIYLYGNTLAIGMNNGCVYFYEIRDWKLFDIANYSRMISVHQYVPILSIDAVERCGKRIFYIASNSYVYTVTGKIQLR